MLSRSEYLSSQIVRQALYQATHAAWLRALKGMAIGPLPGLGAAPGAGGGYTSYGSAHRLQALSPTFAELERGLGRHVAAFARAADWNLTGRSLVMTDCWINFMPQRTGHPSHLHPLSTLSGTYYVRVPRGSPGIKFEDPRLDRFMAAPPRRRGARPANRTWVMLPAEAGEVVLFESWLRHEVAPNPVSTERVSVSFNFNWF